MDDYTLIRRAVEGIPRGYADPDDLAQDIWIQLDQIRAGFDSARGTWPKYLRAQARLRALKLVVSPTYRATAHPRADAVAPADRVDPHAGVRFSELVFLIAESDQDEAILRDRFEGDYSLAEIAERQGLSTTTVHRALETLTERAREWMS